VSGFASEDVAEMGGLSTQMKFAEITEAKGLNFVQSKMCGIIGLAYDTISVNGYKTFFDQVSAKSFSFYLKDTSAQSYLYTPGWDPAAKVGTVVSHNVIEQKYWALNLVSIKTPSGSVSAAGYKGVIDSGTSLLVGPKNLIDQITKGITVESNCSNLSSLPTITFTIDNQAYPLEGKDYVLQVSSSECLMGIRGGPFPDSFKYVIMGDVFMRRYPSLFDLSKNTVSFNIL